MVKSYYIYIGTENFIHVQMLMQKQENSLKHIPFGKQQWKYANVSHVFLKLSNKEKIL